MDYTTKSCREFVTVLASNEPAPGGGGASAAGPTASALLQAATAEKAEENS